MSLISKIQNLISSANAVTGESRTDLTSAVQDLKDGYGQGGLPAEYQAVNWIQGTGDRLLDTGVSGIQANNLIIDAYISNAFSGRGTVFAYGVYEQFFITHFISGRRRAGYFGSSSVFDYDNTSGVINGESRVFIYGATCSDDGKFTGSASYTETIPSGTIKLFGETESLANTHRYHYCKIFDHTTLVRDYQPCYLKSDITQVGFYDFVTKTFNTGTGTTPFIKGNDIN